MIIGTHRAFVAADPDDVFAAVTAIAGLPSATLVALDHRWRVFAYESSADDASRARWTWTVRHAPGSTSGSIVVVRWHLDVRGFLRRMLLSRLGAWQLRTRRVPRSVEALAAEAARRAAGRPPSHRRLDLQAG